MSTNKRSNDFLNRRQDNSKRVLNDKLKIFDSGVMTVEKCLEECKQYKYAAVENRKECFCANQFSQKTKILDDTECNMACDGDETQTCGGPWKMNVYTV